MKIFDTGGYFRNIIKMVNQEKDLEQVEFLDG